MQGRALLAISITMVGCLPSEDLKSYAEGPFGALNASGMGNTPEPSTAAPAPAAVSGPSSAPSAPSAPSPPSALDAELPRPASVDPGEPESAAEPGTPSADGAAADEEVDTPPAEPDASNTAVSPAPAPAPANEAPVTGPRFRFVRLVADSAVLGPSTSLAEFNVLDGTGQVIDRAGWVASADSVETAYAGGAPAFLAIDGVSTSMWHTAWFQVNPPPHPHTLEVDMGVLHEVSGFRYLGRQDGFSEARIANYRFFVSADGIEWGEPAASGTLDDSPAEQEVRLQP